MMKVLIFNLKNSFVICNKIIIINNNSKSALVEQDFQS